MPDLDPPVLPVRALPTASRAAPYTSWRIKCLHLYGIDYPLVTHASEVRKQG